MAVVGQQLLQPEAGWKRYDNTHPSIKYSSGWTHAKIDIETPPESNWNYTHSQNNIAGEKVTFSFVGTKIRIIDRSSTSNRATAINVIIDGQTHIYSGVGSFAQRLAFEKVGLSNTLHNVEIVCTQNAVVTLDAIDIDGRLLHPDEVLKPEDLQIGKRIRCHYQATSNAVGSFSNLGQETYKDGINDFIPTSSSATPNGDFYYICVDKDHLGRWKLIADRNIQHSISWDTLNMSGIASGSGLPMPYNLLPTIPQELKFNCTTRLLTGGVSSTDKDNEWDKYIVSSNLNGAITAGDNGVWNTTSKVSLTSTTPTVGSARGGDTSKSTSSSRVARGLNYTNVTTYDWYWEATSLASPNIGFRPVLLIETTIPMNKSFILLNGEYKIFNGDWQTISTTLPSVDTFISEGMDDLSVFNRNATRFIIPMDNNSLQGEVLGEGRVFRETVDLNKFFDLIRINVIQK